MSSRRLCILYDCPDGSELEEGLEKEVIEIITRYGWELGASGWDSIDGERDLVFFKEDDDDAR